MCIDIWCHGTTSRTVPLLPWQKMAASLPGGMLLEVPWMVSMSRCYWYWVNWQRAQTCTSHVPEKLGSLVYLIGSELPHEVLGFQNMGTPDSHDILSSKGCFFGTLGTLGVRGWKITGRTHVNTSQSATYWSHELNALFTAPGSSCVCENVSIAF